MREPGAVRFEHFLESYLSVTLMYKDIYTPDPDRLILGVTAFHDGILKVFDHENNSISNLMIRKNTVVLDNYIFQSGREGLALFTGLHEAGHILMHSQVYETKYKKDLLLSSDNLPSMASHRFAGEESINNIRPQRTAADWREHQADYFAAAFAMPNSTFVPFINEILREHGYYKNLITLGINEDLDILAEEILPSAVCEVYGVSRKAASIKLKKSGFISNIL